MAHPRIGSRDFVFSVHKERLYFLLYIGNEPLGQCVHQLSYEWVLYHLYLWFMEQLSNYL